MSLLAVPLNISDVVCVYLPFFCIWLCWEYLLHISVFGCVESICYTFLYLVVLRVFVTHFCIWLCWEYLLHISVFGCVVSICYTFLYLVVLRVFAFCHIVSICSTCCQIEDVFLICTCFFLIFSTLSSLGHPRCCFVRVKLSYGKINCCYSETNKVQNRIMHQMNEWAILFYELQISYIIYNVNEKIIYW